MAEFLTGDKLNAAIVDVIQESYSEILLASPYIKLHSRIKDALLSKSEDPNIQIIILFGKNGKDLLKSINKEDFEFLKDLANIRILHEDRLHAKFYSNDEKLILSSMNLYDFSQNNNIEFGVVEKRGLFFKNEMNSSVDEFINGVIKNAKVLFDKVPEFEKGMMGLTKKYTGSKIEVDELSNLLLGQNSAIPRHKSKTKMGFCIRSKESIPFNLKKPYSDKAFESWSKFGNDQYPEKYCHFTGENSSGETCMARPILKKNWKEALK